MQTDLFRIQIQIAKFISYNDHHYMPWVPIRDEVFSKNMKYHLTYAIFICLNVFCLMLALTFLKTMAGYLIELFFFLNEFQIYIKFRSNLYVE